MNTSTATAATGINGVTLHSAFHLPVKSALKSYACKKPINEAIHILRNKYQYLKVLIIDEKSMLARESFRRLSPALKVFI